MKRVIGAVIVLVMLLACGWFLWSESSLPHAQREAGESARTVTRDSNAAPSAEALSAPAPIAVAEDKTSRTTVPSAESVALVSLPLPRARVFGKLEGEDGTPIVGATLWMQCVGEEWTKGVVMPTVEIHGDKATAYETNSDPDGKFAFDLPLPTADWVTFSFEADDFHSIDGREFGPAGGRNRDRLREGDNDLGTFRLANTGTIEGLVRANDGAPIEGAEVTIHGSLPDGRELHCHSGADGRFLLGHVPEGTAKVQVKHDAFQLSERPSITVERRKRTTEVDFILEPSGTISGVVVDERGTPLTGIEVDAVPVRGGYGAEARSAGDGAFTMYLPQNESYRFDFDAAGFDHFGGFTSTAYEPGARDVRLVLKRAEEVEVNVVDAETGSAIERFGIALTVVSGERGYRQEDLSVPKVKEHPNGRVKVRRESGSVMARVIAPGYASVSVPLQPRDASIETQTIQLTKAGSLTGRVVLAGSLVKGAQVELKAAPIKRDASQPDEPEEEIVFSDNYTQDVEGFAGRQRKVEVDADGRFRFDDLLAGHYRLAIHSGATAPYIVESIAIGPKEAIDLGNIALRLGSSINGRIVTPPGREVGQWEVTLDRRYARENAEVGSNGLFHFDGIEPGRHALLVKRTGSPEEPMPIVEVDLASGQTKDVVIDVAPLYPARVSVHVSRAGDPVEGVRVVAECETTKEQTWIGTATDAKGDVSGECTPCDAVRFRALSALQLPLGEIDARPVAAGARLEITLSIANGRARIEFPGGFIIPPRSQAVAVLDAADTRRVSGVVECSSADYPIPIGAVWKDPTIDLGEIAPGEYTISVNVTQLSEGSGPGFVSLPFGPGYRGKLVVRPNELAVCALNPNEAPK
jgi:Carboxypeptidase regulatory-like domain